MNPSDVYWLLVSTYVCCLLIRVHPVSTLRSVTSTRTSHVFQLTKLSVRVLTDHAYPPSARRPLLGMYDN